MLVLSDDGRELNCPSQTKNDINSHSRLKSALVNWLRKKPLNVPNDTDHDELITYKLISSLRMNQKMGLADTY